MQITGAFGEQIQVLAAIVQRWPLLRGCFVYTCMHAHALFFGAGSSWPKMHIIIIGSEFVEIMCVLLSDCN